MASERDREGARLSLATAMGMLDELNYRRATRLLQYTSAWMLHMHPKEFLAIIDQVKSEKLPDRS